MYWRLTGSQFAARKGEENRLALHALVESGPPPGLLAYVDGRVAGWCAMAPRAAYPRLDRSRVLKPIDDLPVWSVVCFFVRRDFRGQGLSVALLRAATRFAAEQGAPAVEGYPVEPRGGRMPPVFAYTGLASAFRRAGFSEIIRRSETRPIMRLRLHDDE
jgi:GNAT superfamily N-acetyltransferase